MHKKLVQCHRLWRTCIIAAAATFAAVFAGCAEGGSAQLDPLPPVMTAPSSIDEAVMRRLDEAGLEPVLAGDTELCRRLHADLVGRFPTVSEVADTCTGRSAEEIATSLQQREAYVVSGLRQWRDRMGTSDLLLYWTDLVPVFDLVEQHQRGEIDYEEFAISALASPGLLALDRDPETRAYRVHRVFLGTDPSAPVALDLARLTRIWDTRIQDVEVFGNTSREGPRAYIVPGNCGLLGKCSTQLVPGGTIEYPDPGSRPFRGIRYDLLTDVQRASLRGLGEHVVRLPKFWEAAADEVLDRLLGWSDGGAVPRRPGDVLPEVRELVVEHLRTTKSIASAERLIIGSLLYRQTHRIAEQPAGPADVEEAMDETPPPRPVWASGPLKFTSAELVLNTLRGSGLREGTCDARLADDKIYLLHLGGLFDKYLDTIESDPVVDYEAYITEFHARQGNWRPLVQQEFTLPNDESIRFSTLALDPAYLDNARAFGGCPGVDSARLTALDGLSYAFGHEVAANELCESDLLTGRVTQGATAGEVAQVLMPWLFSRTPTAAEVELIEGMACGGATCDSATAARGVCVALMGAHEMLFY